MKKKSRKLVETDALNADQSSYMFNPAPIYQQELNNTEKKQKTLKRKQLKEKKQLQKKARALEYLSDEDDYQPTKLRKFDEELDELNQDNFPLLDNLQSDIIAYFQAKSQTILNNSTRVLETTFSHNSLHFGCVSDIGPNGNYLIVNFTRNKKGFVDLSQLRISDEKSLPVSAADYTLGEYLITKVLPSSDTEIIHKLQLTLLPEHINGSFKLSSFLPGMVVSAIPTNQNDYGYDLSLGKFKGFLKTDQTLKLNRVYTLQVSSVSLKDKLVTCDFVQQSPIQIDVALKKSNFQWNFLPGSLYDCVCLKPLTGGFLVKIEKIGVLGYVFQDYINKELKKKDRIQCRLICYDDITRNLQFSLKEEHISLTIFEPQTTVGNIYDAMRILKTMFSGCYWVEVLKKAKKEYSPVTECFLHRTNIIGNVEEFQEGKLLERKVKLKEFNFFDHCGHLTMRDLLETKGISDIKVGDIVTGIVKHVLVDDEGRQKVVVKLQGLQGLIPSQHLIKSLSVGDKVKARVIYVDYIRKSILLTTNPILISCKQFISSLDNVSYDEAYNGIVLRESTNGHVIQFFQGITGFLSTKDLGGQEISEIGDVIKVYVKYVNAKEKKLLLSLKKVDAEIENDNFAQFKQQQDAASKSIQEMQLPTYDKIESGNIQVFKLRKQIQLSNNLLVLESKKYVGVLLKEQLTDVPDSQLQANLLNYYKKQGTFKALVLPSRDGFCQLSLKPSLLTHPFQSQLILNSFHFGYVEKVTARYVLVTLPRLVGSPTGLIYQADLKFNYHQSVYVKVKKFQENRIWLELAEENPEKQAVRYFEQRALVVNSDKTGTFVKLKVTFVKEYGVVGSFNGITGFVMNSNLLQTPTIEQILLCQVLDFDPLKNIADLREVKSNKKGEKNILEAKSGSVILSKEFYSIVQLKGHKLQIAYLWGVHPQGEKISLKIVDFEHNPPVAVPIKKLSEDDKQEGDTLFGTITAIKGNNVFVSLPNKYYGRIHKSQLPFIESQDHYFKWKVQEVELGQRLECKVINVDNEQKRYELSCLEETELKTERSAIVRSVGDGVISIELGHDKVHFLNGWDIVKPEDADDLNNLANFVKPGDACKVKSDSLVLTTINHETQQNILYSIQIFQVKSHHNSYVRVQLGNHKFASIDITEQQEQWLQGLLPLKTWGKCRILYEDEKGCYWASARPIFLDENKWNRSLSPLTGSQLSFKKLQLAKQPCDFRLNAYMHLKPQLGEVLLGYVVGINDFGTFVKFGLRKDNILLVNINEYSDATEPTNLILNRPVLVKVIQVGEKMKGTLRKSMIIQDLRDEPNTNELVSGTVTFIKGDKAYVRIKGYLSQGELTKQNCEGHKEEEGWWFNKLLKVGQVMDLAAIGTRVNKGGKKVVKLTNVEEIVKNAKVRDIKENNEQLIELWESLEKLVEDHKQEQGQIEEEDVQNEQEEGEILQMEEEQHPQDIIEEEVDQEIEQWDQKEESAQKSESESIQQIQVDQEVLNSRATYEKEIISNPDSSELWIKFISFVMESEGIEQARGIAERSLRVINFSNEVEKLNLWTSYLNLEFHFGSEEHLVNVFKKGCNSCNPKKLHLKLIDIYRRNKKYDMMVDLCRSLVQKHKQSAKCWIEMLNCLMEWHQANPNKQDNNPIYNLKKNLERALQCLKKQKHIRVLSHYARLQFQYNQIEQGRNTFDALLSSYPSRTDMWQQYIDLAIKYCTKEVVRELFNRALNVNKKPKKVKFLFKKFLEFETKNGSQLQINAVKERAEQWVARFMEQQNLEAQDDIEKEEEVDDEQ